MTTPSENTTRKRFPPWLRKRVPAAGDRQKVHRLLDTLNLSTVCQSAHCPNQCECFSKGTATFMILGDVCTRDCRFCAVAHGQPPPPSPTEPDRVAEAAAELGLTYVVVTSVTRDDLPDGGADHFRKTILALRQRARCRVEVLIPDFKGDAEALKTVLSAEPEVLNHNIETVLRLYPDVRPAANYRQSLDLLNRAKNNLKQGLTKSGLMLGLGETSEEIVSALRDLRDVGCDLLTLGQYLQPSPKHHPVVRFVPPDEFDEYARQARDMGFAGAASGPFVRSSYRAGDLFRDASSGASKNDRDRSDTDTSLCGGSEGHAHRS